MLNLSNTTGSYSDGEVSGETGNSAMAIARKIYFKNLIDKANTVPLYNIIRYYGVNVNKTKCTIICPFKYHKGGRESTGSFTYFPETNSFHCYGCNTGGNFAHAVEFMSAMENINTAKAAFKILKLFSNDIQYDNEIVEEESFSEKLNLMLSFSDLVRNFRQINTDDNSFNFIEDICKSYDEVFLATKKISNDAIKSTLEIIKRKISQYKP